MVDTLHNFKKLYIYIKDITMLILKYAKTYDRMPIGKKC